MQTLKSVFGVTRALLPVLYFGALAAYFLRVSGGSMEGIQLLGLGPTIIGLVAVGFLFCIPLILKVGKLFNGPPPGSSRSDDDDDNSSFDADAAIARYMASKRSEESIANVQASPPSPNGRGFQSGPAKGFGRRIS
jgi:hypothetical protein